MTAKIDSLKYDVLHFIPDNKPKLRKQAEELFGKLRKVNANNFEAILPIEHVDMNAQQIEWSNLCYGEDYETSCTYTYEDPITEQWEEVTSEERDDRLRAVEQAIEDCRSVRKREKLEALQRAIEDADRETAELMWNTSWQPYGRDVDKGIAEMVPQVTWVEKLTDTASETHDRNGDPIEGCGAEAGTYLTLTCIGQDNGPALMAYVILAHGVVPAGYERYWTRDRYWAEHVIGRQCFMQCAKKLGVEKELKAAFKADAEAAKKRLEEQKRVEAKKAEIRKLEFSAEFKSIAMAAYEADKYRTLVSVGKAIEDVATTGPVMLLSEHPLFKELEQHIEGYGRGTRLKEVLQSKGIIPKDAE